MTSHPPWISAEGGKAHGARTVAADERKYDDIFTHWADETAYLGDDIPMSGKQTKRQLNPPRPGKSKAATSLAEDVLGRRSNAASEVSRPSAAAWHKKRTPSVPRRETAKETAGKPHRYFADTSARPAETPKSLAQALPTKGAANPLGEFIPFERSPSPGAILESIYLRSQPLSGYVPVNTQKSDTAATENSVVQNKETAEQPKEPQPFQWGEAAYSGHDPVAIAETPSAETETAKQVPAETASSQLKVDTSPEEEEEGAIHESPLKLVESGEMSPSGGESRDGVSRGQRSMTRGGRGATQSVVDGRVFIEIMSDQEESSDDELSETLRRIMGEDGPKAETQAAEEETETEPSDLGDGDGMDDAAAQQPSPVSRPPKVWRVQQQVVAHSIAADQPSPTTLLATEMADTAAPRETETQPPQTQRDVVFDEYEVRQCGLFVCANAECQATLQRIVAEIASYQELRRFMARVAREAPPGLIPSGLHVVSEPNDIKLDCALGVIKGLARGLENSSRAPETPAQASVKAEQFKADRPSAKNARKATIPTHLSPSPVNRISVKSKTKKKARIVAPVINVKKKAKKHPKD